MPFKTFFLPLIVLLLASAANCQNANVDSLQHLLTTAKQDTNKIDVLQALEKAYLNVDNDSAMYYNQACEKLILQLNATTKKHTCYHEFVRLYHARFDYKNALLYCLKSIEAAKQTNNLFQQAISYRALFNMYHNLHQNDSAIKYGVYSLQLTKEIGDTANLATNYGNLCWLYKDLGKLDKAIGYGEQGIEAGKRYKDNVGLLISLNNLANCYISSSHYDKAITLFKELLVTGKQVNRRRSVRNALMNLSTLYYTIGDFKKLSSTVNEFNDYIKDDKMFSRSDSAYADLINGTNYLCLQQFEAAETVFLQGLKIAEADSLESQMLTFYNELAKLKFAMHDYKAGNYYEDKWSIYDQQIKDRGLAEYESELNTKYETAKKENEIAIQQAQLKQKTFFNYLLAGFGVLLIVALLLGYRTFLQKQKLQKQRIGELETEKQLTATEAVLKGEEQERTRLAKDLHDGLGGMLSGIKYSLNTMKGNFIMTPETAQAFERSIDMLDSSIQEMRRVAHNMMPEALVKFGLDEALKDFCSEINQSGALNINYQSIDLANATLPQTTAITIYRIVQELVNNSMKHAQASHAIVQVTKAGAQLTVTVEDDGKGFDIAVLQTPAGMGWSNIKNRVEFLKGKLDVSSQPGKGTSVLIEIEVSG